MPTARPTAGRAASRPLRRRATRASGGPPVARGGRRTPRPPRPSRCTSGSRIPPRTAGARSATSTSARRDRSSCRRTRSASGRHDPDEARERRPPGRLFSFGRLRLRVLAELVAHHAADLAERGAGLERGAQRLEQIALAAADLAQLLEPAADRVLIAVRLELLQPRHLLVLGLGVDAQDLDVLHVLGHVLVHAHDDVLLGPVALLIAPRGLLDLAADEGDALDRSAHR